MDTAKTNIMQRYYRSQKIGIIGLICSVAGFIYSMIFGCNSVVGITSDMLGMIDKNSVALSLKQNPVFPPVLIAFDGVGVFLAVVFRLLTVVGFVLCLMSMIISYNGGALAGVLMSGSALFMYLQSFILIHIFNIRIDLASSRYSLDNESSFFVINILSVVLALIAVIAPMYAVNSLSINKGFKVILSILSVISLLLILSSRIEIFILSAILKWILIFTVAVSYILLTVALGLSGYFGRYDDTIRKTGKDLWLMNVIIYVLQIVTMWIYVLNCSTTNPKYVSFSYVASIGDDRVFVAPTIYTVVMLFGIVMNIIFRDGRKLLALNAMIFFLMLFNLANPYSGAGYLTAMIYDLVVCVSCGAPVMQLMGAANCKFGE